MYRGKIFYEPYVLSSFFSTAIIALIAILILTSLMRSKVKGVSAKIIYFYIMSFVSLMFLLDGLAVFITMIADLIVALGEINIDIKKAFLACSSLLVVATPSYLFHWTKMLKGLGFEEEEKTVWPYYKYMILGLSAIASLVFFSVLFHQIFSSILGISKFNWNIFNQVLGYGLVGIIAWLYHWFIRVKFNKE